jgi:hypothetical protein
MVVIVVALPNACGGKVLDLHSLRVGAGDNHWKTFILLSKIIIIFYFDLL